MANGTCSIEGCENGGPITRGWCGKHYKRWSKHGDPLTVVRVRAPVLHRGPHLVEPRVRHPMRLHAEVGARGAPTARSDARLERVATDGFRIPPATVAIADP